MEFLSIGSGSGGNCTVLRQDNRCLLVDCGFSAREALRRIANAGVDTSLIECILVTHEHGDHLGGVAALARVLDVPVFMSKGTRDSRQHCRSPVDSRHLTLLSGGERLELAGICVSAWSVPHDAGEPLQFTFETHEGKLGILSDLGHIPEGLEKAFAGCMSLMLEFNHDVEMLRFGPYPASLKRRVGGPLGHLSNDQAARFLSDIIHEELRSVIAIHLSETNNADTCIRDALAARVGLHRLPDTVVARQEHGFGWASLRTGPLDVRQGDVLGRHQE